MRGSVYSYRSGPCKRECGSPEERKRCPRRHPSHLLWGYVCNTRKISPGHWEQRRKQGLPTRKQAEDGLVSIIGDVRAGTILSNAQRQLTVAQWADQWLAGRVRLRPATVRGYRLAIRDYISPLNGLGRFRLVDLTTGHIESWLNSIRTGQLRPVRRPEGVMLTAATVNQIFTILRAMLSTAASRRMIGWNPCTGVELEDAEHEQEPVWSPAEVATFLAYLEDAQPAWAAVAYRLALRFGLRRGEIAALRWDDITEGGITVHRNAVAVGSQIVTGPLKAKKGGDSRTLPLGLDPGMVAILAAARKRQLRDRMAAGENWEGGDDWRDSGYVVADHLGAAIPPWRLTDSYRGLCKAAGLRVIKLHTARKTCGTHLYEATLDIKKVQKWLGHSTAAVTAEIYIIDRPETDADSAAQVARYLAQ